MQLDIFNLEGFNEGIKNVLAEPEIKFNTDKFILPVGTLIHIDHYKATTFEIMEVEDDMVKIKYISGSRINIEDEMEVKSEEITAIAAPTYIPLATYNRSGNLDLNYYQQLESKFVQSLTTDKAILDVATYLLLASHSTIINNSFLLLTWLNNWDEKYLERFKVFCSSASSYVKKMGAYSLFGIDMYHTGHFFVTINHDYENRKEYEIDAIINHYHQMKPRLTKENIESLNPFELMLFYRLNGYVLNYRIETDEYTLQHPFSSKTMPILGGRELLNDMEVVIKEYEERFVPKEQDLFVYEMNLFGDIEETRNYNDVLAKGFKLPAGAVVKLLNVYRDYYKVVEDNGVKAVLKKLDNNAQDTLDVDDIEVNSEDIGYFIQGKNIYLDIKLPRYNRPENLTVEELISRKRNYFNDISDKEFMDYALAKLIGNADSMKTQKFIRAIKENDEMTALEILKKDSSGGCSGLSNNMSYSFTSNGATITLGYGEIPRTLEVSNKEMIKMYKGALNNIKAKKAYQLSIGELIIAYLEKGFTLTYDHITNEYSLKQGLVHNIHMYILGGRAQVSKVDETINNYMKKH